MRKRKTVTAIAFALGLMYMPPALYADHHQSSGMDHGAHEVKAAAKGTASDTDTKDTATAGAEAKTGEAADAVKDATPEGSATGMDATTSKKVSEGSH